MDSDLPKGIVRSRAKPSPPGPLSHAVGEGESGTVGPTTLAQAERLASKANFASAVFPSSPDSPSPTAWERGPGGEGRYAKDDVALTRASRELSALARKNRQKQTAAEAVLWQALRRKQIQGRAFRRQHPLGRFIADFFCDDARLIIEVDGAYHEEATQAERDQMRQEILEANDLFVLRFTNEEIFHDLESVIKTLSQFIRTHSSGTSTLPRTSHNPDVRPLSNGHITAIEPQARHEGRVNVYVDGKFALGLFEEVAVALGLRVGQAVTPERLEELAAAETQRRAREDAYRLLSYRDRAEGELADRLRHKGYEEAVIADVQEHLRLVGFLNDETFAERWVANRGGIRGRRALQHELRIKGIDAETIAGALDAARDGETERAAARIAAIRHVGERPADRSRPAQAKLSAFLSRRGFDWDTIRPVLAELYGGEPDEASE